MKKVYLDYAAATPMDERVLKAMRPYWTDAFYNPSAQYLTARQVARDLQAARQKVASVIGAKPNEVIFTAGGTEADNLAVKGVMEQFPDAKIALPAIEHDAVLSPAGNYKTSLIAVQPDGLISPQSVVDAVDNETVLVSIIYANNEIGVVQPLPRIAAELDKLRQARRKNGNDRPLYLHTDASQAGSYLDLHASRLGVDMMTLNGGKLYGPKQTGILFVKSHVRLKPLIEGGGQERGIRSGTENVAGFIGFAEALDIAQSQRQQESERLKRLQSLFVSLLQAELDGVIINGSLKYRLPNNVHVTIPNTDNERLIALLDDRGVMCAAGSACSASDETASHVLKAIGLDEASARSSLRFSMGRGTTEDDIRYAVKMLKEVIHG